jgi:undecaprenyl-diphosphatase
VTRSGLRAGVVLLVAAISALIIVPQAAELGEIGAALRQTSWLWVAAAALASAATYPMAAIQLMGATRAWLPPGRTTLAQVASAVPNLAAPGGVGGAGLNVRFLERCGLGRAEAVAAVTLANIAGFVVHVAGLAIIGVLVTGTAIAPVREPPRWALLAGVAGLAVLAGAVFWSPLGGGRLPAPVREMARSFLAAVCRPRQAALLLAGSTGVTAGYVIALWCSLRAFGAQLPAVQAAAAYLAGASAGAISPTPGGLGAVEATLVATLARFGVPGGTGVVSVLVFRFVTYWLPAVPGAAALRELRRRRLL